MCRNKRECVVLDMASDCRECVCVCLFHLHQDSRKKEEKKKLHETPLKTLNFSVSSKNKNKIFRSDFANYIYRDLFTFVLWLHPFECSSLSILQFLCTLCFMKVVTHFGLLSLLFTSSDSLLVVFELTLTLNEFLLVNFIILIFRPHFGRIEMNVCAFILFLYLLLGSIARYRFFCFFLHVYEINNVDLTCNEI